MPRILSYLMAATPLMPTRQRGATLIEYALIVALIAVAVFLGASATGIGGAIGDIFGDAQTSLEGASEAAGSE